MVTIRSNNELILSLLDLLRVKQPSLDTKPGTVSRDLFIEAPASQLSLLYDSVSNVSDLQSLRFSVGNDLDNFAQNFSIPRKQASPSSGVALFTFSSIPTTIAISKGSLITASNGVSYSVVNGVAVNPSALNSYRAVATRYRSDLDFLGITDQYAVEVAVIATTSGIVGNISKFGITKTNISGVSNVTNIYPFSGGANQELDDSFRNRILAVFSGSNVGTELGYKNSVLTDSAVLDALVIGPGDPLMVRDGTTVYQNPDRSYSILSEGSGGKVDVLVLGTRVAEYIDTFIYRDASNKNDPTDSKNIFTLGQISGDSKKTVNRKRIDNLKSGILPAQPVREFVEVTGSSSGSNFALKSVDSFGRVTGNYELIKDSGVYSGSPWGFDQFHWISDRISNYPEDKVKGRYNGQDNTAFTDVLNISSIQQNLSIQNENSSLAKKLDSSGNVVTDTAGNPILDSSNIQLNHVPATSVTRVFNLTTGERYTVTSQNPDGTGTINQTGRVTISGNTLPSPSDTLQVDYTWIYSYDPYVDYDGRYNTNNPRDVQDSVDWGYSNAISNEIVTFSPNTNSTYFQGAVSQSVSTVISVKTFSSRDTVVSNGTGIYSNRLVVLMDSLLSAPLSIDQVLIENTQQEIFNTSQKDGVFFSEKIIVAGLLRYTCTIVLPSDTAALAGDTVSVRFDSSDIYTVSSVSGNYSDNLLTIPATNIPNQTTSFVAAVSYIANVTNLFNLNLTDFPVSKIGNGFQKNSFNDSKTSDPSFLLKKEFATVVKNSTTSGAFKLNLSNQEFSLNASNIYSVVRITDGYEIGVKAVTVDTDTNYVISLLPGSVNDDNVIIFYNPDDLTRTQPLTFGFNLVGKQVSTTELQSNGSVILENLSIPNNMQPSKVAIYRLSDGLELSDLNNTIDYFNSKITFSSEVSAKLSGNEKVIVFYYNTNNLRSSFSRIAATLSDQITNQGTVTIAGQTVSKGDSIVFTAINDGLTQNVSEAIRKSLGLLSNESIPNGLKLVRLVKLEKVSVDSGEVVSVLATYDVLGTRIRNNTYFQLEMLENLSLSDLDFTLPSTVNNQNNAPSIGDQLRLTFYWANISDTEDLVFSRNGVVYSNKMFALINKAYFSSGFTTLSTGKLSLSALNQPITGTRYKTYYDYLAPKPNERIIIRYNYNKLISDATIALEPQRPISADVLVKEAISLLINVSMAIVIKSEYINSTASILQNVKDRVTSAINTNKLGDTLDSSDLSAIAQAVTGVDRVRITGFNINEEVGLVLSIVGQKNEYFVANSIQIISEGR